MSEADGEEPRKDTRSKFEILHPEGARGGWRDLPWLLRSSLRLVCEAGRREFVVTAALQLVVALGATVQLFVNKAVLAAVLRAGGGGHYGGLVGRSRRSSPSPSRSRSRRRSRASGAASSRSSSRGARSAA